MGTDIIELGPVDVIVISYPPDAPRTSEAIPIFIDLVDRGVIRVLDVAGVQKNQDGTFEAFVGEDIDDGFADLVVFSGASPGLIGNKDLRTAADEVPPGTAAIVIVYENRWAAPFVAAVRRNGGELLGFQRVSAADLLEELDEAGTATRPPSTTQETTMPLIRGIARTAVIAGTATAVSNRVSRRQARRWQGPDEPEYAEYEQPAPPPPAAPVADPIARLKELAELKSQGILTDEEFAAEKAKILGS